MKKCLRMASSSSVVVATAAGKKKKKFSLLSSTCSLLLLLILLFSVFGESSARRRSGKRKNLELEDYDHPDQNDLIPIPDHYLDDNDDVSYDDEEELEEINDGKTIGGKEEREENILTEKILLPIYSFLFSPRKDCFEHGATVLAA